MRVSVGSTPVGPDDGDLDPEITETIEEVALPPGTAFGAYVLDERIGGDRTGLLYRAHHAALGTAHRVRVLPRRTAEQDKRLRELVQLQGRLRHPNVLPLSSLVELPRHLGLLSDPVDAPTLAELLADNRGMPADDAMTLFAQMLGGVHAAHRAGVLHLALVPGAVHLVPLSDRICPRVADFGLAGALRRLPDHESTATRYIAPELGRSVGDASRASDVYSLAVILYEMITGVPPYWGRPRSPGSSGLPGGMRPLGRLSADCPPEVTEALQKALQYDPADRLPDCEAFARVLFGEEFVLFEEDDETELDELARPPETTRRTEEAEFLDDPELPLPPGIPRHAAVSKPGVGARVGAAPPAAAPGRAAASPGPARPAAPPPSAAAAPAPSGPAPARAAAGPAPSSVPGGRAPGSAAPAAPSPAPRAEAAPGRGPTSIPPTPVAAPPEAAAPASTVALPPNVAPRPPGPPERIHVPENQRNARAEAAARESEETQTPPSRVLRSLVLLVQLIVFPLVLGAAVVLFQAGMAGWKWGEARDRVAMSEAAVGESWREAVADAEALIAVGGSQPTLRTAVLDWDEAKTLSDRVDSLEGLRDALAQELRLLPIPKDKTGADVELARRRISKSVDTLLTPVEEARAAAAAFDEAAQAPLVELGKEWGFADKKPFGFDLAPLLGPPEGGEAEG